MVVIFPKVAQCSLVIEELSYISLHTKKAPFLQQEKMRLIFAAQLLAFVVFFNSIELSSQSGRPPSAPNTPSRNEPPFLRVYRRRPRPRELFPSFSWPKFSEPSGPPGQGRSKSLPASPVRSENRNPPSECSRNQVHNSSIRPPERIHSPVRHPSASPGHSSTGSNIVNESESSDYLDIHV